MRLLLEDWVAAPTAVAEWGPRSRQEAKFRISLCLHLLAQPECVPLMHHSGRLMHGCQDSLPKQRRFTLREIVSLFASKNSFFINVSRFLSS
jgi:hypothetical protein